MCVPLIISIEVLYHTRTHLMFFCYIDKGLANTTTTPVLATTTTTSTLTTTIGLLKTTEEPSKCYIIASFPGYQW